MKQKILLPACCSLAITHIANGASPSNQPQYEPERPNILFICVDDLRTELGCYGSAVKTPNLDSLALEGSLFFNHYVQVPTSGASRASLLTGRLPRRYSDTSNEACRLRISEKPQDSQPETFFHQLRMNGYHTIGIGKIGHSADGYLYEYTAPKSDKKELPKSWDELLFDAGKWGTGWNAFFGYSNGSNRQGMHRQVKPYECANVNDEGLPDGLTAKLAIEKLEQLAHSTQPFCLAVGFFKPHLPFTAPKRYWELYDEQSIPLSPMKDIPVNCDKSTLHESGEFNGYLLGEEKASLEHNVSDAYARKLRHAYFACISYVDAQIGKVLNALKKAGKADNTIIIVWGDHGWHLGDLRVWGKHTLHEPALNSTLIIKAPGFKKGIRNERIVSSVDIYPTLMDLCQTNIPSQLLDGHSFVSLLNDPQDKNWREFAYSYFNHGISLRTPQYRLTRYLKKGQTITELYQYNKNKLEKENIANKDSATINRLLPDWFLGSKSGYKL